MKYFLSLLILILSFSAYSQENCPGVKTNNRGIEKVSNLNPNAGKAFTCRKIILTGVIKELSYISETSLEVESITVETSGGQKRIAHFGADSLFDCFSKAEKEAWQNQLRKSAKVKVIVWACDADGKSDLTVNSIEFVETAPSFKALAAPKETRKRFEI